ncbi:uncharacterized protein [Argopecten irradians]|uniref:uncharacterized protein n=1 Tax=Argopecten irradians TaxID=31199 RepID=UPI003714F109
MKMAVNKKNRHARRFGLAGGIHQRRRRNHHVTKHPKPKEQTTYECTKGDGLKLKFKRSVCITLRTSFKNTRAHQLYRHPCTGRLRSRPVKQLFDGNVNIANGYRFMNLHLLEHHVSQLTMHSAICDKAKELVINGISPIKLCAEVSSMGLASILSFQCKGCKKDFLFNTSPKLETSQSKHFDINVRAVWGSIATGNGNAHLNEFIATCDAPGLGQSSFQRIEHQINTSWCEVLQKDIDNNIQEEKQIAISKGSYHQGVPAITVICDGGWSKRSHKHSYNALGGVAIIIGSETKKILHIGVRNKHCYICSCAETAGTEPKPHECFRNWNNSSQSMESDIILEGFLKADHYGIRYMKLIGDGDSSVFASIREKVPIWGPHVEKLECANHTCKCLRGNLEKLVIDNPSFKGKGNLTKAVRIRMVTAVRCAIRMRSSNPNKEAAVKLLAHDIRNSVHHIFGDHTKCSKDFCKAKKGEDTTNIRVNEGELEESDTHDIISEQASYWTDGMSLQEQEQSRGSTGVKT